MVLHVATFELGTCSTSMVAKVQVGQGPCVRHFVHPKRSRVALAFVCMLVQVLHTAAVDGLHLVHVPHAAAVAPPATHHHGNQATICQGDACHAPCSCTGGSGSMAVLFFCSRGWH